MVSGMGFLPYALIGWCCIGIVLTVWNLRRDAKRRRDLRELIERMPPPPHEDAK